MEPNTLILLLERVAHEGRLSEKPKDADVLHVFEHLQSLLVTYPKAGHLDENVRSVFGPFAHEFGAGNDGMQVCMRLMLEAAAAASPHPEDWRKLLLTEGENWKSRIEWIGDDENSSTKYRKTRQLASLLLDAYRRRGAYSSSNESLPNPTDAGQQLVAAVSRLHDELRLLDSLEPLRGWPPETSSEDHDATLDALSIFGTAVTTSLMFLCEVAAALETFRTDLLLPASAASMDELALKTRLARQFRHVVPFTAYGYGVLEEFGFAAQGQSAMYQARRISNEPELQAIHYYWNEVMRTQTEPRMWEPESPLRQVLHLLEMELCNGFQREQGEQLQHRLALQEHWHACYMHKMQQYFATPGRTFEGFLRDYPWRYDETAHGDNGVAMLGAADGLVDSSYKVLFSKVIFEFLNEDGSAQRYSLDPSNEKWVAKNTTDAR